ncbi:hypothetical protein M4D71_25960 [Niallia taxi]|uniref:hypothetical protein n=1 Tax=Niallia taxi TaxID=2499688 RepID=UPI0021A7E2F1|nr:hypothetical protein [Niallia taxi]MCT2347595.1 hypothetical protein [Niallia taxi]
MQAISNHSTKLITLYDLDKTFIRSALSKEKYYKVPTKTGEIAVKSRELSELLIEHQTKDEIRKLVNMLKTLKKRNTSIGSYMQTIAIAILND